MAITGANVIALLTGGLLATTDAASDLPVGYVEPAEADVLEGVQYGADGTEFTGTLEVLHYSGLGAASGGLLGVKASIHRVISFLPDVAPWLARWDFGAGEEPAVFTVDPAPESCGAPLVAIRQEPGAEDFSTRGQVGMLVTCTATIWGDKSGSDALLERLAHSVWRGLKRATLDLGDEGYEFGGCDADAPAQLTDAEGYPGYQITIRVKALEA